MQIQRGKLHLPRLLHRAAKVRRGDAALRDQFRVRQPRPDARLDLIQREIGGDDGRQLIDVAIVDDLEQFLLRPAGGILCAKVVQHQELGIADVVEAFFEGGVLAGVGEAQRIQQIGHGQEESWHAHADGVVGDGRRQMCLPGTISALQQQPAVQVIPRSAGPG